MLSQPLQQASTMPSIPSMKDWQAFWVRKSAIRSKYLQFPALLGAPPGPIVLGTVLDSHQVDLMPSAELVLIYSQEPLTQGQMFTQNCGVSNEEDLIRFIFISCHLRAFDAIVPHTSMKQFIAR